MLWELFIIRLGCLYTACNDDQFQSGDDIKGGDIEEDTGGIQDQANVTSDKAQQALVWTIGYRYYSMN